LDELINSGGIRMGEHWLISGANRGIGLELSRRLLARGDHVTSSVRSEEARGGLLAKLAPQNAQADTLVFGTRDEEAIRAAARTVSKPIDVLVANAGAYGPKRQSTLDMNFDGALDLFSVNALGPLRVAQAFLPLLLRATNPRIVFMSSVLGSMALEGSFNIAYRAAKAALNKIVQGLAEDLKADGVTVIALHPGWVRTDMGGPDAPLSVEESAAGIIETIDALTIAATGNFLDYLGETVAW
jgi:NAD(P)-dependent dehydrogenase (short-subunit alcohol dehydrogenase family)